MSLTSQEIQKAGKTAIDFYLKNKPIDQVSVSRPLLKHLMKGKKPFPGSKEHIVEQIRKGYGSSAQWFDSSDTLTFSDRDSIEQARFGWYEFHDGISLYEGELAANGITMDDNGKGGNASDAEKVQLTNLLTEKMEVLRLGAEESLSQDLHLSGASSTKQIVGLDGLLPLDNTTGTIGGISRSDNKWWRHNTDKTLTAENMNEKMMLMWRECMKRSKASPNVILAGGEFIDEYRKAAQKNGIQGSAVRYVSDSGKGGVNLDMATSGLYFNGIPIEYCPEWDDNFGGKDTTPNSWSKRCYFLNMNHLTLRPISGSDFVTRHPASSVQNPYKHYWAVLWRGGLTMNMPSAHAALCLA